MLDPVTTMAEFIGSDGRTIRVEEVDTAHATRWVFLYREVVNCKCVACGAWELKCPDAPPYHLPHTEIHEYKPSVIVEQRGNTLTERLLLVFARIH